MNRKTEQLQIRVSADQKARLRELARAASMDVSSWVLSRVLPDESERFRELVAAVAGPADPRVPLAELADYLKGLPTGVFERAVASAPSAALDPAHLNYLAGAIELASRRRGLEAPGWTRGVPVPVEPMFGSELASVRLHLLLESPVALRRRNLFMDASFDDRV